MAHIRILLAGLSRMLADIVRRVLTGSPDLEVVGTLGRLDEVAPALLRADADVLIVGLEGADAMAEFEPLLATHPYLKIFALDGDGRRAVLYELRPHSIPLGELSPQSLIDAIRSAVSVRTT